MSESSPQRRNRGGRHRRGRGGRRDADSGVRRERAADAAASREPSQVDNGPVLQRQKDLVTYRVTPPRGYLNDNQLRALAEVGISQGEGRFGLTPHPGIEIPDVAVVDIGKVRSALGRVGLGRTDNGGRGDHPRGIRLAAPPGTYRVDLLLGLGELSKEYGKGGVFLDRGQGFRVPGVSPDRFDAFREALQGRAGGLAIPPDGAPTVTWCDGGGTCPHAIFSAVGLAGRLAGEFPGRPDPVKLAFAVAACGERCMDRAPADLRLVGAKRRGGLSVQLQVASSKRGRSPGRGSFPGVDGDDLRALLALLRKCIAIYHAQRKGEERFADLVDRLGSNAFPDLVGGR